MFCEGCHKEITIRFAPRNAGIYHDEKHPERLSAMWWGTHCRMCCIKYIEREYRDNLYGDERYGFFDDYGKPVPSENIGKLIYKIKARQVGVIAMSKDPAIAQYLMK